jgi:hypothetical protein
MRDFISFLSFFCSLYENPPFDIARCYGEAAATFMIGVFYSAAIPLVNLLAIVGGIFSYWVHKVMLFSYWVFNWVFSVSFVEKV